MTQILVTLPTSLIACISVLPAVCHLTNFYVCLILWIPVVAGMIAGIFVRKYRQKAIDIGFEKNRRIFSALFEKSTCFVSSNVSSFTRENDEKIALIQEAERASWYVDTFVSWLAITFIDLVKIIVVIFTYINYKAHFFVLLAAIHVFCKLSKSIYSIFTASKLTESIIDTSLVHKKHNMNKIEEAISKYVVSNNVCEIEFNVVFFKEYFKCNIQKNDIFMIKGKNGYGKTSLCRKIAGKHGNLLCNVVTNATVSNKIIMINSSFIHSELEIEQIYLDNIKDKVLKFYENYVNILTLIHSVKTMHVPNSFRFLCKIYTLFSKEEFEVIIMDEILDICDLDISKDLISFIKSKNKTLVFVSHKLSLEREADFVLNLKERIYF